MTAVKNESANQAQANGKDANNFLSHKFGIDNKVAELLRYSELSILDLFTSIDKIAEINQYKVISAMQDSGISDSHFPGTTGYGYDDRGRELLDSVFADIFKAEDALVRHQIAAGTQAISLAFFGCLRPGDKLLSITGKPYDTLEEVIGIRKAGNSGTSDKNCDTGSLRDFGIKYSQVELLGDGSIDIETVKSCLTEEVKMVFIQRSKGYSFRRPLFCEDIEKASKMIKSIKKDVIILVDNCYGEFVEDREPLECGADLAAGSLIKNPGGGLALSGGYIAGTSALIKKVAGKLTSPGLGKKVGPSLGFNRSLFQGLYMAPHIVGQSLKGATLCSSVMQNLGFEVSPKTDEKRGDIIQAIRFGYPEPVIAFCQGIQKGSPVDAFVTPEPWDMPGYDCRVIMAAGAFVQGSSIELSADAPIKPPYIAYMQGGMTYAHVKLGLMKAIQLMYEKGIVRL